VHHLIAGGSGGTFWDYIDVDRQPTEVDFRAFGWMTIRATDLHARLAGTLGGSCRPSRMNSVNGQTYCTTAMGLCL